MKKPTNAKRLQLETQVVRALDDASLTKAQGAGTYQRCSGPQNQCSACCLVIHI